MYQDRNRGSTAKAEATQTIRSTEAGDTSNANLTCNVIGGHGHASSLFFCQKSLNRVGASSV
jgi:hypothetical protein